MTSKSRAVTRALTAVVAILLLGLTACGGDQAEAPDDVPEPEPTESEDDGATDADAPEQEPTESEDDAAGAIPDGMHAGRLVSIDTSNVTLDLVRVLSGDEAVAAAEADGVELEDGTLPNDFYIQDLQQTVTLPVAGDGGFQIFDCSGGCELVGTTLDALVSGEATPYGGANPVVEVQVDAGTVVSLVEVYLP